MKVIFEVGRSSTQVAIVRACYPICMLASIRFSADRYLTPHYLCKSCPCVFTFSSCWETNLRVQCLCQLGCKNICRWGTAVMIVESWWIHVGLTSYWKILLRMLCDQDKRFNKLPCKFKRWSFCWWHHLRLSAKIKMYHARTPTKHTYISIWFF
jgi:hypothetical protein